MMLFIALLSYDLINVSNVRIDTNKNIILETLGKLYKVFTPITKFFKGIHNCSVFIKVFFLIKKIVAKPYS